MSNNYRYEAQTEPWNHRLDPTGAHPIEMGDLVIWTAAGPYIERLVTGTASGPLFVGVAEGVGPTPTSNIDNATNLVPAIRVREKGIFRFKTTAGDVLAHGDPLVVGADAQTVLRRTIEAATEIIGYVHNPESAAAVTGAGGVEVRVRIASNFPAVGIN